MKAKNRSPLTRIKPKHIFITYLLFLFNFVVLKFHGDVGRVLQRVHGMREQRNDGYWNIDLVPFKSIRSSINFYLNISRTGILSINLYANIIIFVPLGFLIPFLLKKPTFLKTICLSMVVILLIESVQFITLLGVFDIDDFILNGIGSILGYLLFLVYKKDKFIQPAKRP